MTYVGVEFDYEGGISLLHCSWLTPLKREVYWPPKQTKKNFLKLLKSDQDVPEDGSWKLHTVKRIFFQTDDYETAERKIKKAEDTSNLQTEAPEESSLVARKRIRKQIRYSSDELSDSEIDEKRKKQKKQLPRPPLLSSCSRGSNLSESCDSSQRVFQYRQPLTQYTSSAVSSCHSQPEFILENSRGCGEGIQTQSPFFIGKIDTTPQSNIRRPTATLLTRDTLNPHTIEENYGPRYNKFICDSLKTLKEQMNQVLDWIRKQDHGGNNTYTALPDDIGVDLPLKSESDLEKLEVYIADKNNFFALSSYLSTLGGRDFTV